MAMKRYKKVQDYIDELEFWQTEIIKLREIILTTELVETVKWGMPYYSYKSKNVVGISGFKSYFGLWFTQGALLRDEQKVLINAQEGKTKAMRQWRMTSEKSIKVRTIKAYISESIELVDSGKEIKAKPPSKIVVVPPELEIALKKNKQAHSNFKSFAPFKQKEFAEYIATAKRQETKAKRLEKILPMLMDGIGLNDKYR